MAIFHYATKEEVPSDLSEFATQVTEDGDFKDQWSVNVVPRKKLEEFRDKNTEQATVIETTNALVKKIAHAAGIDASKLDEFDATAYTDEREKLLETARKVSDGKLKESDDIDKVVSDRTEAMRTKFDEQLQAKQVELSKANEEKAIAVKAFKRTFIDRAVAGAVTDPDLGVEPTAMGDIMQRAYSVFVVEDDESLTPKKGEQTLWGEDGSTPMTMKEWINITLRKESPHYFMKSTGGGASGGEDSSKQFGGMSQEAFNKLPALRRLEIANKLAG